MPETLIDCIPRLISTFVLQKEYDVINIKSCKTTTFDKLAKKWNEEKFEIEYLQDQEYVVLENLAKSMVRPCFIDIKLQCRPYNKTN